MFIGQTTVWSKPPFEEIEFEFMRRSGMYPECFVDTWCTGEGDIWKGFRELLLICEHLGRVYAN